MLNKKLMILTFILVSLLAVSAVGAADNGASDVISNSNESNIGEVVIDNDFELSISSSDSHCQLGDDDNEDDVLSAKDDGTFKALRNKIDSAASGSTLILENDYVFNADTDYELTSWGSYNEITPYIKNKDLTIDGKGHTIDANHLNYILGIGGTSTVVLKNINFKNGCHYDGASGVSTSAVRAGGYYDYDVALSVVGCSFENCYNGQYGGAVTFDEGGHGSLTDCSFLNCSARRGGAVYQADNVAGCSFLDCSAEDGGTVFGSKNIVDCSFKDCDSITVDLCDVVSNCNFINCSGFWGSAVSGAKDVVDCNFSQCSGRNGAAISSAKNVRGCRFIDCTSPISAGYSSEGGAINSVDNVVNCYFRNCCAKEGGAIYGVGNVDGCTFEGCSAVKGGAIYYPRNVTNSNFANNVADEGSAMYISYYTNPVITNCNFKDNSKNCQIFFSTDLTYYCDSYSKSTLSNLNFEGNGIKYGGGISFENNTLTVIGDVQYLPSNSGDTIDLSKLVYISGDVSVNIAGKTFKTALNSGVAKIDLSSIADGTYDATISYSGCEVAPPLEVKLPLTIKSTIKIQANDVVKYYGGSEKYTVTVTNGNSKVSGVIVNFKVNGKTSTSKTDSNGQATIPLDLPVGTYDIESTYNGASATSKVTVKSTLTANDASGTYLNSKVTATFSNTDGRSLASKQVTFKVGDKSYSATTNSNGVATANVDLGVGTYTVTAVNPVNNEQKQSKLVIAKANSAISLPSILNMGATTLTATLTPASATGSVVFNVNGVNKNAPISNGKATLALNDLQAGNYTVTANYAGDNNLNPSKSNTLTFNVAEVYPILTANDLTKTYGTGNGLVVNLADSKANAIANAIVNVNINNKVTQIKTDTNGWATMAIGQAPGTYYAKITYPGAKEVTSKIVVKKAKVKMTAKAKTFKKSIKTKKYTITLKNNLNKPMKNTKVTIKVNKKTYTAKTNKKGVATFKLKKLTKKGKYTATITYKGNAYYNKLTKKVKITVK